MEEKDWVHQCALISHNMFSKTNTFNFYIKKSLVIFFLDNFFLNGFFGSNSAPKNCFLEPNLIQKPTRDQNIHPKKNVEWFFYIKIERIGF